MPQHVRHFIAQRLDDGTSEGMRMVELHDAPATPLPVPGRARVTVDEHHVPTSAGEGKSGEESGRPSADDDRSHLSPI
jgi:hypothetical protein